ncbi:MAG: penicillin acylase family protein [Opitutus sp.]
MSSVFVRRARGIAGIIGLLLLLAAVAVFWFYRQLHASLPQLEGTLNLAGLSAPVTVLRDGLGVPTIRGGTRSDVARALGFLHAQDRFFQMDLLRRRAAGELAELFGKVALPLDRATKPHRFRTLAQQVVVNLPAQDRELLEAYAAGVNAGVNALGQKPFEYLLVRAKPTEWKPEDSALIVYAMTLELQDSTGSYELSLTTLRDRLGPQAVSFFAPLITPQDSAIDRSTAPYAELPGPRLINLREQKSNASAAATGPRLRDSFGEAEAEMQPGSNSFALAGSHTATGAGLLANDPHLNLSVPNIWYRAVLEWPGTGSDAAVPHRVVGVSLPGLPFIVLGSNGHVAWGLTDAYADTNDLVAVDVSAAAGTRYRVPGTTELAEIEIRHDTIAIKGGAIESVDTPWTIWGPIVGRDDRNRPLAHHWIAHDPTATDLNFMRLEAASNVAEALSLAQRSGIPAHNFVVVDRGGDIGWTIAGKFPKRVGFDGRLPVSWTFGDRRWDGFVSPEQVPLVSTATVIGANANVGSLGDPSMKGRLWTANNRVVGGQGLALLGDGGYAPPARANQIRDQLATLERATPADLLKIQLDDRALFLERWRTLLLTVLTPEVVGKESSRAELRRLVETWEGHASVDSVSYRLVRTFRSVTSDLALAPIFAPCVDAMPAFDWRKFNFEPALWALLDQKPIHLLDPKYASWEDLLVDAADRVVTNIQQAGRSLDQATWGSMNTARINHPMGNSLPLGLGKWLNFPRDPLAGDIQMPRIQGPAFGASMRLVVSPGHEEEALFEMPGGQSGHPLSTFYRAGHAAWVKGEPAPLLPGETKHTLRFTP